MPDSWLIAVDLDGTLFHTDHQVSARTIETLHAVVARGHRIVVATGRGLHSAMPRLQRLPPGTRLVCSNGAYEVDRQDGLITWATPMAATTSSVVRQRVLDHLPTASFGWETVHGLGYEVAFEREAGGAHTLEQGGRHAPPGESDVLKLFVKTPERRGGDLARTLQALLEDTVEVSASSVPFVEVMAAGATKGAALARIAADLGIEPSRTMAFGDGQNDVSMLRWAEEAVAMGNAVPELKDIADAYAPSHADDGVARFLEGRFLA